MVNMEYDSDRIEYWTAQDTNLSSFCDVEIAKMFKLLNYLINAKGGEAGTGSTVESAKKETMYSSFQYQDPRFYSMENILESQTWRRYIFLSSALGLVKKVI